MAVPWIARLVKQSKRVIHVFRRHQRVRTAFAEFASTMNKALAVIKPGATRHGTWYMVIYRLLELRAVLVAFVQEDVLFEEMRSPDKRALYKDVKFLVHEYSERRKIAQTYWADCERFIFITRPTFHALKVSDMNTPQLGKLYVLIKNAASHMKRFDQECYDISYKVRWELDGAGTPVVSTKKVHFRETPVLEAAYCVHPKYMPNSVNLTERNKLKPVVCFAYFSRHVYWRRNVRIFRVQSTLNTRAT